MKRKRIHILLATALLMAATITGCDQNKSGKQPAEPTKVENEQQIEVTMEVMEALAKVMPKYNEVYSFSEGLAAVSDSETHLYGFIDKMGNEVIPCQYNYIYHGFKDGIAVVSKSGDDRTLIDKKCKEIASFNYPFCGEFQDGLMPFMEETAEYDYNEGYLDMTGKVVIPADFEISMCNGPYLCYFSEGLCGRYDNETQKTFFIDKTGKKVFECEGEAEDFSEGLAAVSKCFSLDNDDFVCRFGFVDKTGFEAIPFIFNHAGRFVDGLCWAETDNQCGFINRDGKFELTGDFKTVVLEEGIECGSYPLCPTFSEGLAWVSNKEGKFGYIDKTGKVIVPFRYEPAYDDGAEVYYSQPCYDFHEGLARIYDRNASLFGFIDREGNEVFPFQFDDAYDLCEGLALVMRDGQYGFIDTKGNCTLNLTK
jgi:hypothetical protein